MLWTIGRMLFTFWLLGWATAIVVHLADAITSRREA